jgi:ABC-type branched-subunit amino acid transport system ATPase component
MNDRRAAPALEVKGLDVYYGHSHALQGVDLTLDTGVFSVVGRNGMGKTTLCKAIMGLVRASGGSIRIRGEEVARLNPARIARLGVGYVPQGRRLWRSLTVDEHLALAGGLRRGAWTIERIYDIFPRLAERKNNGGNQLSGGEQQMLAISRALLTNPHLLIMDEPTEGLAPVIVAQVEDMLLRLGDEGDISVLVIEQNIGVARRYRATSPSWSMAGSTASSIPPASPPTASCSSGCSASAPTARMRPTPERLRRRPKLPARRNRNVRGRSASMFPIWCRRRVGRSRCRSPASKPPRGRSPPVSPGSKRPPASGANRRHPECRGRLSCWWSARSTPRAPSCASSAISSRVAACAPDWSMSRPAEEQRAATSPRRRSR